VHDCQRSFGHGRYVIELADRLRHHHDVHVFANTFEKHACEGVTCHRVPAWRCNALTTILSFIAPATLAVGVSFDIIHAQGLCGLRHNVVTAHICNAGWFAAVKQSGGKQSWRKRIFRSIVIRLERLTFRPSSGRRFIAVSARVRDDLAHHYGLTEHVDVIHHGVDIAKFHPANVGSWRAQVRCEVGLSERDFVALYVGDWQKAGLPLVRGLSMVPDAKLLVVSRTPADQVLRDANCHGVAPRIVLAPPTDRIERYYAAADAFLFPTFYDSFGMVLTEAMASGVPVITSRAAGASELVQHEKNGLILEDAWDERSLARHLQSLMNEPTLRQQLGDSARESMLTKTWDEVATRTLKVYEQVLNHGC
jgi:UDP-glucose:(heptosyl)LPS alpha-1,3-glucosyltransferase